MSKLSLQHFRSVLVSAVILVLVLVTTACAGTATNTGATTTGTTTSPTQPSSSTTQTAGGTTPTVPATPTTPPAAFKAGGISFIGPVKSITTSSLTMTAPNGQVYTLALNAQTNVSAFGGVLPTLGASIDMDAAANPDGSFTATILKPARAGDPDLNVIAYTGITTSAVGADRVIHFTSGIKSYTFTIPATAVLTAFGGNAQAIGVNVSVKVKVQYPAQTVVSVGNAGVTGG